MRRNRSRGTHLQAAHAREQAAGVDAGHRDGDVLAVLRVESCIQGCGGFIQMTSVDGGRRQLLGVPSEQRGLQSRNFVYLLNSKFKQKWFKVMVLGTRGGKRTWMEAIASCLARRQSRPQSMARADSSGPRLPSLRTTCAVWCSVQRGVGEV